MNKYAGTLIVRRYPDVPGFIRQLHKQSTGDLRVDREFEFKVGDQLIIELIGVPRYEFHVTKAVVTDTLHMCGEPLEKRHFLQGDSAAEAEFYAAMDHKQALDRLHRQIPERTIIVNGVEMNSKGEVIKKWDDRIPVTGEHLKLDSKHLRPRGQHIKAAAIKEVAAIKAVAAVVQLTPEQQKRVCAQTKASAPLLTQEQVDEARKKFISSPNP